MFFFFHRRHLNVNYNDNSPFFHLTLSLFFYFKSTITITFFKISKGIYKYWSFYANEKWAWEYKTDVGNQRKKGNFFLIVSFLVFLFKKNFVTYLYYNALKKWNSLFLKKKLNRLLLSYVLLYFISFRFSFRNRHCRK